MEQYTYFFTWRRLHKFFFNKKVHISIIFQGDITILVIIKNPALGNPFLIKYYILQNLWCDYSRYSLSGNSANLSARNADSRLSTAMSGRRPATQQSQNDFNNNNDGCNQRMSTTEVLFWKKIGLSIQLQT